MAPKRPDPLSDMLTSGSKGVSSRTQSIGEFAQSLEVEMPAKLRKMFIAIALPIGLAALVPVMPASAENVPDSPTEISQAATTSTDAWMAALPPGFAENQDALLSFNRWLSSQSDLATAGYVAAIEDDQTRSATLLWTGSAPVPDSVWNEASALGIKLGIRPWPWSMENIMSSVELLVNATDLYADSDFQVADVVGLDPGFVGVTIEGDFPRSVDNADLLSASIAEQAERLVGMPVRVRTGITASPAYGRDNDTTPFAAGGYMISGGHTCSSGFAIKINGTPHTTTARHCTLSDYVARDLSSSKYANGQSTVFPLGGARYLGGAGYPIVLDGPWNSQNYSKHVLGYSNVTVGNYVCASGGNSGIHCNIKVDAIAVAWNDGYGPLPTVRGIQQTQGAIATIQGDSGGPVITLSSGATADYAAGMIQAIQGGWTGSACGAVRDAGSNKCSNVVLFTTWEGAVASIPGGSLYTW